ncbi:MAG: branched-chain amino acid transport system II carrier protein [Synergistaceae bacterium]|nr:branched-chain amino acid transport system II carrier protein [Synergistaceae bacterium]
MNTGKSFVMHKADLLVTLVDGLFQDYGSLALACVAIFACLTTAIGLAAGASFFCSRAYLNASIR